MNVQPCVLLLGLVLVLTPPVAASQQCDSTRHQPLAITYDSTRLTAYSNTELIDLLSAGSQERNAAAGPGLMTVVPVRRELLELRAFRGARSVRIPMTADSMASKQYRVNGYLGSVERELFRRGALDDLACVFAYTFDLGQRAWIEAVFADGRGPAVDDRMRRFIGPDRDETTYFALKYFAAVCDSQALATLNRNYHSYPTSSLEWASIVEDFGICRYASAVPNLVESLDAASLNLGQAALEALAAIFPDGRTDFASPDEAQQWWRGYVASIRNPRSPIRH